MKKNLFIAAIFLVINHNQIISQTIQTENGLTTAIFKNNNGSIKVRLPADIRPGDHISGSIVTEPAGKNAKQVQKNLAELKKYSIDLNGQRFPVSNAALQSNITNEDLSGRPISLVNSKGVNEGQVNMRAHPSAAQQTNSQGCTFPSHALAGSPLRIKGSFDGDASNTKCNIGGQACEVLAESSTGCFVQYPENAKGISPVTISERNSSQCSSLVQSVQMELKAGKLNLLKGEKTTVSVEITGLQSLPDTAKLYVANQSTEVVQLAGGNKQLIVLTPAIVKEKNTYSNTFNVNSIKTGDFNLNFYLALPPDDDVPPFFFDIKLHPLPVKGLKNGMADAFEKAYIEFSGNTANKYPALDGCGGCIGCIRSMLKEDIVALVGEIGKILIDHYADILVAGAGGALAWIKDKYDKLEKAEDIASAISDAVSKGEIQVVEFKERLCGYCLVSAIGFYDAKTQCMDAFFYCKGSKLCCTTAITIIHLKYCVNDDGFKKPDAGLTIDIISK